MSIFSKAVRSAINYADHPLFWDPEPDYDTSIAAIPAQSLAVSSLDDDSIIGEQFARP